MFEAIVAAIALMVARVDRRRDMDAAAPSYEEALYQLYSLALTWSDLALDLQRDLTFWIDAGCPEGQDFDVLRSRLLKEKSLEEYRERLDPELRRFLQIHAPELVEELDALAERSLRNLDAMIRDILSAKAAGTVDVYAYKAGFDSRTEEVLLSVEQLREFLQTRFR